MTVPVTAPVTALTLYLSLYLHVKDNPLYELLGPCHEAEPDARAEDLGERVEPGQGSSQVESVCNMEFVTTFRVEI